MLSNMSWQCSKGISYGLLKFQTRINHANRESTKQPTYFDVKTPRLHGVPHLTVQNMDGPSRFDLYLSTSTFGIFPGPTTNLLRKGPGWVYGHMDPRYVEVGVAWVKGSFEWPCRIHQDWTVRFDSLDRLLRWGVGLGWNTKGWQVSATWRRCLWEDEHFAEIFVGSIDLFDLGMDSIPFGWLRWNFGTRHHQRQQTCKKTKATILVLWILWVITRSRAVT